MINNTTNEFNKNDSETIASDKNAKQLATPSTITTLPNGRRISLLYAKATTQPSLSATTYYYSSAAVAGYPQLSETTTTSSSGGDSGCFSSDVYDFSRTFSAQSLPPTLSTTKGKTQQIEAEEGQKTPYERALLALANDPVQRREVVLAKRVALYRLCGVELGAGHFSKVKLGIHELTQEKVAVKVLLEQPSTMNKVSDCDLIKETRARFRLEREIEIMELTNHPNIIRLFEVVSTLSKDYLVMEYAGGGDLCDFVFRNEKLSEEAARPIFAQIVSAVTHIHSRGIVHRDIKAENIFFSRPGFVKLGDFGFACRFDPSRGNLLKTYCGSPPYAAPELLRDENYDGTNVDIWALGVLFYFMLTGVTPFEADTVPEMTEKILAGAYTIPDHVGVFARQMLRRMLEVETRKRAKILEIGKMYWLRETKASNPYNDLSSLVELNETIFDGETSEELKKRVFENLNSYGITEEMLRESQKNGVRDGIVGTYRIVLWRCESKEVFDKVKNNIKDKLSRPSPNERFKKNAITKVERKATNCDSKLCIII